MERLADRTVAQKEHQMPFGTAILPGGEVCFRLWAPQARVVDVCLYDADGGERILTMNATHDGWFTLTTDQAHPGIRYHFRIDGDLRVPDPASRYQPEDVHDPSELVDPRLYRWRQEWPGRPWEEAVFYELHVGTFTPEGTFRAVIDRLDYLKDMGVTAIELMPVADFPGPWNWGYDGVLQFAPDSRYGRPDDLKDLVQAAHEKGMMMFLDVVYNHFGPEGNYLHVYAKSFFNEAHQTPWGAAINFDAEGSRWVRKFFIHNVLYWLEEYDFDGLRMDAIHAIADDSERHFVQELSEAVRRHFENSRRRYLVLENDDNQAHLLDGDAVAAQWNDDFHHAVHVLLTGESRGYYSDYAEADDMLLRHFAIRAEQGPLHFLGRTLTEGFAYQGEPSAYRNGTLRGEPSKALPLTAFVNFIQNHDQTGNRAFGERLSVLAKLPLLRLAAAVYLLAPSIPMIFMGEEFGCEQPFLFFCDLGPELAPSIREGRRNEFSRFPEFSDPEKRERIPDPGSAETFERSRLDWSVLEKPDKQEWLRFYRELVTLRHREIVPRLSGIRGGEAVFDALAARALQACWTLGDGSRLILVANFSDRAVACEKPQGRLLYESADDVHRNVQQGSLDAESVLWLLDQGGEAA